MTPEPTTEETATALRLRLTIAERALDLHAAWEKLPHPVTSWAAKEPAEALLEDWIADLRPLVRALRNREESPR